MTIIDPVNNIITTQTPVVTTSGTGSTVVSNSSAIFQKHILTGATRSYDFSAVSGLGNKKFKLVPSTGCILTIIGAKVLAGSVLTLVGGLEYQLIFTCMADNDNDRDVLITELSV